MADAVQLKTEPRTGQGSRDANRLRKAGRVPAVVYGHKEATVAITVSRDELAAALRHHARTVDLMVDGKTETALIQEVQHDHLGTGLVQARAPHMALTIHSGRGTSAGDDPTAALAPR